MMKLLIHTVILLLFSISASAQLAGKITDTKGDAVPFASVIIQGTTKGTTANEDALPAPYRWRSSATCWACLIRAGAVSPRRPGRAVSGGSLAPGVDGAAHRCAGGVGRQSGRGFARRALSRAEPAEPARRTPSQQPRTLRASAADSVISALPPGHYVTGG